MKIHKKRIRRKHNIGKGILFCVLVLVLLGVLLAAGFLVRRMARKKTKELLAEYMGYITEQEYGKMYQMIDPESSGNISEEEFIKRNSAIYEGIEAENMQIALIEERDGGKTVIYRCSFDTIAGEINFENEARFVEKSFGYKLAWEDGLIFPQLGKSDRVQISVTEAKRGRILDRNGQVIAGEGVALSVGLVPGKMTDKEESIRQLSVLLEMDEKAIEGKLSAQWVKEDSFVPVKTIPKTGEPDVTDMLLGEAFFEENSLTQALLEVPGVMITDVSVRSYPLGEAAAHLIGYVQSVSAEDLEEHAGEGYTSGSMIGRSGMEGLYEKELKGQDGYQILIKDAYGDNKALLAVSNVRDGEDVRLTIDAGLQKALYEQFREDESCSVAINPYTGEVLALVSTPSFDNNDFILGLSDRQWTDLNEDEKKPLYNRFRQTWCPGSTFKPIIAAIGLNAGTLNPLEDFGNEGMSWQKDTSWGDYYVTTLHEYEPVILENALMYSDNIYFAKAALRIGAGELIKSLQNLGFGEELPFEITVTESQYSNTEGIDSEVQLADSGYGQGQILVNPIHLAALYTAFCNQGDVLQPRLFYQEQANPVTWLSQVFSEAAVEEVLNGMKKVINDPNGTGYAAHREDILLAGKTGTAEIKASKDDHSGTELGWLAIFTADPDAESPILLVSMAENVKEIGGSGYVVEKDKAVLNLYLKGV
ncbi:MAG: penicillin-binding transpeptidase domain-containing protein [Eubacteriales bacterium]|nr:penicillin-binding transpeptidase domain-containing protein [Eubacteriales bacterium]